MYRDPNVDCEPRPNCRIMDVIATAMACSLGYDVRTACAAARAGLTRADDLPFTMFENDRYPGLAVGHCVPLLGGGFAGDARLIRLLEGALRDLVGQASGDLFSILRLAFYLAFPASDRERQGLDLIADEDERADYLEQIGESPGIDEHARGRTILQTALDHAALPPVLAIAVRNMRVSVSGHTAAIDLFERAQRDLQTRPRRPGYRRWCGFPGGPSHAGVAAVDRSPENR